ncbi:MULTISPECIES: ABC transporter permease [unclassified Leptolyngbya]|uniref:ABC transporter permease n=1 Tax=unclassified Leptolyngbya TaxID=2650499 RepID=UPI0016822294|nr:MULTISPECIES: ABC transporter permease [unclassified Leptolyngbya]MBD1914045.1 ABC transporter permease [Leptolyngbya sp. FACHB-8]MBD2152908.1 ABC transporter permease [Leptolyngbya sp. FACHB-16]
MTTATPATRFARFRKQRAVQRFLQSTSGMIGLVLTALIILMAVLAPILRPYDPAGDRNYAARLRPPSPEFWFGTDGLGRDILSQVWYGLQTSLLIGLVAVAIGMLIGVALGLLAGYFRGRLETVVGWMTDVMLAFPSILLAIAIVTVTGPSVVSVMFAVGLVQLPKFIRLTRSMVLSLREQEFVQTVRAFGATPPRIILRHILPASLAPIVVQATLAIGTATLEAAGLGFLGLGAQPPTPELGTMLSDAFKGGYSLSSPWTIIFPGLFITLTVLAFNLLGDGLRDALDPRSGR